MIDSTTLPYWIIGIVIAIIVIALIIYFGLKRGKSKQVSFEKKEEPKELTQAEKSGNYQAKSGFNFAAGGGGDKQPVVNEGQSLTATPAKNTSSSAITGAVAGAGAAGVSAAAAATAQARELKKQQEEAQARADQAAQEAPGVKPAQLEETAPTPDTPEQPSAHATSAPVDDAPLSPAPASSQPETTPASEPKSEAAPAPEPKTDSVEPTHVTPAATGEPAKEHVADEASRGGDDADVQDQATPVPADDAVESEEPSAPAAEQTSEAPAAVEQPVEPKAPAEAAEPAEAEDMPAPVTHPTQDEINESAVAAAHQVEAAEAALVLGSPEPTGDTVTAEPADHEVQTDDIAPAEGRLGRLRGRLSKSNNVIGQGVLGILSAGDLDEDAWEEIEDTLIMADLGASTTMKVVDSLREKIAARGVHNEDEARAMLRETLIEAGRPELDRSIKAMPYDNKPAVVLVVGVNGTGKTTTVGKLGRVLVSMGHSVMFGAADTFRAAAADQLEAWGRRVGASTVRGKEGADPASVAFDAVAKGTEEGVDVVLVDTAGRLHTSTGLMDQLGKVKRVVEKKAKVDEVLLVLDATVGQNGIIQARTFRDVVDITGVVLTKLDGTAKGGIVFQVQEELGVPVKLVGLGEGADDLAPFEVESFVDALLY
ncbi:MAG: signal recognition particle-docking protein FtsY [Corynebacterium glucuronolyticum]|nr:signal recognition particle-docking protein FtsY [Mycobacteriaceae bacterium]MDY5833180.1 signal recognition particle-docking protein FtsY [Corynebacterium glucuronolyticum]